MFKWTEKELAVWSGRKRILGMPISFTKYILCEHKIITERGLVFKKIDEVLLYRITDMGIRYSLLDRILGVGTVMVYSADISSPVFGLEHIRDPFEVKAAIEDLVEKEKEKYGIQGRDMTTILSHSEHLGGAEAL